MSKINDNNLLNEFKQLRCMKKNHCCPNIKANYFVLNTFPFFARKNN